VPPLYCDSGSLAAEARDIQADAAAALTMGAFATGVSNLGSALTVVPGMQAAGLVAQGLGRMGQFGVGAWGLQLAWRQVALAERQTMCANLNDSGFIDGAGRVHMSFQT
jgi:hypothetical protein